MLVEIDDRSGFCVGVVKAIEKAEGELGDGKKVYSLGDIMHNKIEMRRLKEMGLESISLSDIESHKGDTILIRAHGEPPTTYNHLKEIGAHYVDATCSVVANLQKMVKRAHEEMASVGGQVVILGKHGHPEVVGLTGQIEEDAIVIDSVEELIEKVNFSRPIYLLSQTTKSLELFHAVAHEIEERCSTTEAGSVTIKDTICRQVSNRYPHLAAFSVKYDVVIFVSGAESSNGKALFEACKAHNPNSYKVEDEQEIEEQWFKGVESVGVCGATSTPLWLMKRVATYIQNLKG